LQKLKNNKKTATGARALAAVGKGRLIIFVEERNRQTVFSLGRHEYFDCVVAGWAVSHMEAEGAMRFSLKKAVFVLLS